LFLCGARINILTSFVNFLSGKDTPPAVSLHSRPKDAKPENFPAPGDYNPDKAEKVIHDNAPRYTFGLKTNVEKPVDTPGMF
jgi:hypothetical protein